MAMPAFVLKLGELDRDALLRMAGERAPLVVSALLVVAIAALLASHVVRLLSPPPCCQKACCDCSRPNPTPTPI